MEAEKAGRWKKNCKIILKVSNMEETKKRGRGRPRKEKTEPTKKEIAKEYNNEIEKANEQLDIVAQKFVADPTPFFADREKEIAKVIEKYGNIATEDLENGVITKKDYSLIMAQNLIKPLIPRMGLAAKHTPFSLLMTSDFYWDKIVLPVNEKTEYIPSIFDLFKLLSISQSTFIKYANNGDEDMREACAKIKDEFINYYQRKGLQKQCSEIMAMFVLKTTFGQRENDQPQIAVVNVNNSPDEKISKYARQHGFEVWKEEND